MEYLFRNLIHCGDLVNATAGIGITYHGYGHANPPEAIDYIVLRGPIRCESVQKWTEEENGVFLSDHDPVCADLAFT